MIGEMMTQLQEDYTDVNDYFCRTLNQSKFSQCKIMKGNVKYKIYKHTIIYILLNFTLRHQYHNNYEWRSSRGDNL